VRPLPDVVAAYRTGAGVPYGAYGPDLHEGQAAMNCPAFMNQLAPEWLPVMPDVHARLMSDPPARIADIGCGHGWASIGMARGYPKARVDGFDLDAPSIERARINARTNGVADRVAFQARDAGDPELAGRYDLVTAFECVHDMSHPVAVLDTMRRLAGPGGAVMIMDERVGDAFSPAGTDTEWFMYGFSILHCLPVGMVGANAVGTGTVMRTDTLRRYAREAGFRDVEVLPIENFFFRFYRLRQ
jgi:2-polyprenyl-3-methyl-5-hydroxy-6-metoxy-1,4-benzoquinol methylase